MKDPFRYLDHKKRASMELILVADNEEELRKLKRYVEFTFTYKMMQGKIMLGHYEEMEGLEDE